MKIIRVAVIVFICSLLVAGAACGGGGNTEPTPTPTASATPTPLPTIVLSREEPRDAIQAALIYYHNERGEWPTANGQPGDIGWTKLVLEFMVGIPHTDSLCDWWVSDDPEGEVCLQHAC